MAQVQHHNKIPKSFVLAPQRVIDLFINKLTVKEKCIDYCVKNTTHCLKVRTMESYICSVRKQYILPVNAIYTGG